MSAEKLVVTHCGTKSEVERGADHYRITPESEAGDVNYTAVACVWNCPSEPRNAKQHAHGMAAWPELLEALEGVLGDYINVLSVKFDDPSRINDITRVRDARKAIQKAKGLL